MLTAQRMIPSRQWGQTHVSPFGIAEYAPVEATKVVVLCGVQGAEIEIILIDASIFDPVVISDFVSEQGEHLQISPTLTLWPQILGDDPSVLIAEDEALDLLVTGASRAQIADEARECLAMLWQLYVVEPLAELSPAAQQFRSQLIQRIQP